MPAASGILRLFVAVFPDGNVARELLRAIRNLELPAHKLTPPEHIHITMQFIGDTESRELENVMESVERSAAGLKRFTLTPSRLLTFPERGPARLLAAETDAPPTLLEIQRRLAHRLARSEKHNRPFRPHLTLCRFRSPVRALAINQPIAVSSFNVDRIVLMKSTLKPTGAVYGEVMAAELAN